MFHAILDSRVLLASAIFLSTTGELLLARWCWREAANQKIADSSPKFSQYGKIYIGTGLCILLVLVADRWTREVLGGGFLVLQLAGFASTCMSALAFVSLRRTGSGQEHVRYSAKYMYEANAARLIGMAIVTGTVSLFFWSGPFFAGTLFILATAAGWFRRSRQATAISSTY